MLAAPRTHVSPRAAALHRKPTWTGVRPAPLVPRKGMKNTRSSHVVAGLFGLGVPELAVIAGVVALIYGPSKLPELGKGLGKTAKSFQTAAKEFEKELKEELKDDETSGGTRGASSSSSQDD